MRKILILISFSLFLTACTGDFPSEIEGEVYRVDDSSVHIAVYGDDPEAEYPVYEVVLDDNTIIQKLGANSSSLGSLEKGELEVGDWVVAEIRDRERQMASKIVVKEE